MAITFVVFTAYAWVAATARSLVLGAPKLRQWIQRAMGALVLGCAARLVTER